MSAKESARRGNPLTNWMDNYKNLEGRDKARWWGNFFINNALYIVLIILIVIVTVQKPEFLRLRPMLDILQRSASGLVMALGIAGCIVLTGTDLSAGRVLGLTACVSASLLQSNDYGSKMFPGMPKWPTVFVFLLVIAIGALVGLVNGFFVSKFSLHPFIVSLATQLMVYGTILIYVNQGTNAGKPISGIDKGYSEFIKGSVIPESWKTPIPHFVWYAIILTVIMWFIWNKTTFGKNMYAVGSNPEAANVSGVNVALTITLVFVLAGIMYGVSGFIEAARIGSNSASTGLNAELDAIAACVIGGVSFTGGVGRISGVVVGVILLNMISVALQWLAVSADWTYIIKGVIILAAVSIDMQKYLVKK
ncbi:MAG TPA: beta-methylgalactoside transporter [Ruminococcaceae bacterium]|nr:beta-methylgalactoside transporter [Oscillospiraceae bacterium]